jgi:hypothetical protein
MIYLEVMYTRTLFYLNYHKMRLIYTVIFFVRNPFDFFREHGIEYTRPPCNSMNHYRHIIRISQ